MVRQVGAVDTGQVMIAAIPGQHDVDTSMRREFVDDVSGQKKRHVDGADEGTLHPPAAAAARSPRPVANSGPTPRTSSRNTSAFSAGSA